MDHDVGKPAVKLALELAQELQSPDTEAKAAGPYINFRFKPEILYKDALQAIFTEGDKYGSSQVGLGKKILLEYCSPNIAKRLSFQHIRSTLIGSVLSNIYKFLGFDVGRINFVGDWGAFFGE